jgi:hypothetical protein
VELHDLHWWEYDRTVIGRNVSFPQITWSEAVFAFQTMPYCTSMSTSIYKGLLGHYYAFTTSPQCVLKLTGPKSIRWLQLCQNWQRAPFFMLHCLYMEEGAWYTPQTGQGSHPSKLSPRDWHHIVTAITSGKVDTATEAKRLLGLKVCDQTVKNALAAAELHACVKQEKPCLPRGTWSSAWIGV